MVQKRLEDGEEEEQISGNFVLDSSVIIKWFSNEENTDLALKLREGFLNGTIEIAIPDLQLYEIANALGYNKKLGVKEVVKATDSLIDIGLNIVVPTKEVISSAIEIAFQFDITLYDAYFIALAKELSYDFVTADEDLYNKIKSLKYVRLLKDLNY